jgi:hypothetical protein
MLLMVFWLAVLALLLACSGPADEASRTITRHVELSGRKEVNLADAVPGLWAKVCVLGPYSDNRRARDVLGFDWNVETKTSIQTNEGISLLLFVRGADVLTHIEHPRSGGDFTNLSGRCFLRKQFRFVHDPSSATGWPGLFNKNAT